ncbi:DUF3606 domain-containing protein [Bosea sp. RCC_152_1]|uniref:DUF3606 domain-containing protein n=1 Tax=Bosea sp. RCC_152_1 TaxID=3239228 RepID=UPI0035255F41
MADDKDNRGSQDRSRISLSEDYEVRYWTDKFVVSKAQLEGAVRAPPPMLWKPSFGAKR